MSTVTLDCTMYFSTERGCQKVSVSPCFRINPLNNNAPDIVRSIFDESLWMGLGETRHSTFMIRQCSAVLLMQSDPILEEETREMRAVVVDFKDNCPQLRIDVPQEESAFLETFVPSTDSEPRMLSLSNKTTTLLLNSEKVARIAIRRLEDDAAD